MLDQMIATTWGDRLMPIELDKQIADLLPAETAAFISTVGLYDPVSKQRSLI